MKTLTAIFMFVVVLTFSACGQSQEAKAQEAVCTARDDIQTQIASLKAASISDVVNGNVKTNLNAIKDDLETIKNSQSKLAPARKQEVETANDAFKTQFEAIALQLTSSLSLKTAGTQVQTALAQLTTAYRQALAPLTCS